ncbi:MAG: hypothetical protein EB003_07560 [Flavobacteriia bacterium]|nr:hypothetical protein [Flavobacteriia bacterium]
MSGITNVNTFGVKSEFERVVLWYEHRFARIPNPVSDREHEFKRQFWCDFPCDVDFLAHVDGIHAVDIDANEFSGVIGVRNSYAVRERLVFPVGKVGIVVDAKMFVGVVVAPFCSIDNFIDDFTEERIGVVVDDVRKLRGAVEIA